MTFCVEASYDLAKFGGHKHRDRGDTMLLVCHVIL